MSDAVSLLWMDRLLRLSELAGARGEIPVAAALLDEAGRCVGWGSNRRHRRADPLGHAELLALRQAAAARGDWRFNGCTLLVTGGRDVGDQWQGASVRMAARVRGYEFSGGAVGGRISAVRVSVRLV